MPSAHQTLYNGIPYLYTTQVVCQIETVMGSIVWFGGGGGNRTITIAVFKPKDRLVLAQPVAVHCTELSR